MTALDALRDAEQMPRAPMEVPPMIERYRRLLLTVDQHSLAAISHTELQRCLQALDLTREDFEKDLHRLHNLRSLLGRRQAIRLAKRSVAELQGGAKNSSHDVSLAEHVCQKQIASEADVDIALHQLRNERPTVFQHWEF